MEQEPFYKKSTLILLGLVLFVYILFVLSDILIPLAFAGLFSILLNSLCNRFMRLGFHKVLAICVTLLIAMAVVGAIFYFLSAQLMQFGEMLPALKVKFANLLVTTEHWISQKFGISLQAQTKFLNETAGKSKDLIGTTLNGALGVFSVLVLIPIYIFLLLYYKTLLLNFIFESFSRENSDHVAEVLKETKSAIQSYVVGLLIETFIIAVLNSVALLLIGVEYAILLGVIGAILNLVPYVGGIVAIGLPVLMATVSQDGYTTQLAIIGAYSVIQFIDNNFLVPLIVSSKVQINALISILGVLAGGALWGVSGMFLSIPFIAVLKIIFDRIDGLKPWGKLFGDHIPVRHKGEIWRFGRKPKTGSTT